MPRVRSTKVPPSMVRTFAEPGDRAAYWKSISPDGEPIILVVTRGKCQDGQSGYTSGFSIGDPEKPRVRAQDTTVWAELRDCWKEAVRAIAAATDCDPSQYRLVSRG